MKCNLAVASLCHTRLHQVEWTIRLTDCEGSPRNESNRTYHHTKREGLLESTLVRSRSPPATVPGSGQTAGFWSDVDLSLFREPVYMSSRILPFRPSVFYSETLRGNESPENHIGKAILRRNDAFPSQHSLSDYLFRHLRFLITIIQQWIHIMSKPTQVISVSRSCHSSVAIIANCPKASGYMTYDRKRALPLGLLAAIADTMRGRHECVRTSLPRSH